VIKLRRVFALLTSVTMLHLSVLSGDAVCLTHGAEGHHASTSRVGTTAEHAMEMHGHVMPLPEAAEAPVVSGARVATAAVPPCEIPAQQHCCEALVGCSVAGAVTSEREVLAAGLVSEPGISEAAHDAPASFASAPEPPPPKA
jgi:hypothetical protein